MSFTIASNTFKDGIQGCRYIPAADTIAEVLRNVRCDP